jgi:hypothetical protein
MSLDCHRFGQALCALFLMLESCLAQSAPAMPVARPTPATQMATYVLDVDTNFKGEFGLVAPQLTEALQTAFSEKRDVFKILERRHLDQLVKANQLEKDLQAISHGDPASPQFVRQVRADGFIRGELVDGPDGVVLTVTLVNLNSEVMWEGQAKESRAGWLLHDTQTKDAAKLAGEAEVHFNPSPSNLDAHPKSPAVSVTQPVPSHSPTSTTAPIQPGTFVTGSYRLSASALKKDGNHITLSLTAQSLSDKPLRFGVLTVACYLLDDNGNRWNQDGADSAGFSWSGVDIDPGMKIKSNFTFVTRDSDSGTQYSLSCPETNPQQGRRITIRGITDGLGLTDPASSIEGRGNASMAATIPSAPKQILAPIEGSGLPSDIKISIQQCPRSGEYVNCWGFVTNYSDSRQRFHFGSTKPVDDLGNSIPMGYYKKGASRPNFSGNVETDLVPNVPTRFDVPIWDPHPAAKKFSALVFDEVIWEHTRYAVTLLDVPIQTSN